MKAVVCTKIGDPNLLEIEEKKNFAKKLSGIIKREDS